MQAEAAEAVIRQERTGDVAVLVLANPPVNALSNALRGGLAEALAQALADPEVKAIVLRGEGRGFCAGADISEFGKPRTALRLGDLCKAIEASPKPVVAAIHGMALGGGMELALAAHYRVAGEGAVLGLPEVNLGLLPGAGGTQRLPRLVGAKDALRMMLSGVPIPAREAATLGLVDLVVDKGITEAAIALAAQTGLKSRPTGDRREGMADARAYMASVAEARATLVANRLPAPARIVDLVEAALIFPLEQGLIAEETAFGELVTSPEAAGLRHAFFVERRALQLPKAVAGATAPDLQCLGLWGAGEEITDLACQALAAGLRILIATPDRDSLVSAVGAVAARQEQDVAEGRMSAEARDADWARLDTATGAEALAAADLILVTSEAPALPDGLRARHPVAQLGAAGAAAPEAITPASGKTGLAELGQGPDARPAVLAALAALARRLNWRLVPVGPGGPLELGLRQALAGALDLLSRQGIGLDQSTEALGRWLRPRKPAGPGGLPPAAEQRVIATCLAALAAEGARMVEDGRAPRPATIDAIAMMAGLVPRWEGGPMFQADRRGLLVLRRDLIGLAEASSLFLPPALIDGLIAEGRTFGSLNEARG